ncbi:MAG: PSD1 and planctomycete cytochrome C domain-containing protein [Isosphaeraceae bacterium]
MTLRLTALVWLALALLPHARAGEPQTPVDFARDVQPVLSDRCYPCHGPDASTRKGKLRLDRKADAFADRGGYSAFVAGKPDESEAFSRITADDDTRMPPSKHGKSLSKAEVVLVKNWLEQGAPWPEHWAFTPPTRPASPQVKNAGWPRNPIDAFVLARLEKEGLGPSPEAAKHTLIRRVSFDLTGLPPTPEELNAFLADHEPGSYERVVDRLLHSRHFGERLAMDWLDLARYADTDGYQGDATRTNWPWRDWVVSAFNSGMPFDRFTVEQFAGDLLPNATHEQILATAFHRNHMTNGEGGRDPEESRVDYVIDRINTTGTVWLGLTLGCCQCHSHKFDPVTQADYYSLSAFFNSIDEDGKAGKAAKPYLAYKSPFAARALADAQQRLKARQADESAAREAARPAFDRWLAGQVREVRPGFRAWRPFVAARLEAVGGTELTQGPDGVVSATGPNPRHEDYRVIGRVDLPRVTGLRLDVLPVSEGSGLSRSATGHFILTDIKIQARRRDGSQVREIVVGQAVADFSADTKANGGYGNVKDTLDDDPRNGWASFGSPVGAPHAAIYAPAEPLVLAADEELIFELRHRSTQGTHNIGRFRLSVTDEPDPAGWGLAKSPRERLADARTDDPARLDPAVRTALLDEFLDDHPPFVAARQARQRAEAHLDEMKAAAKVDVMVLSERAKPRETHVLIRGNWDRPGEKVGPDTPAAVAPWPEGEARTRLGLARWLVSGKNPLTARVEVNRLWQSLFGAGLVRTPEDFGRQGEPPTHPEVLDWLAVELVESGWDLRHLLRTIVTSATYRQSSAVSDALRARDPDNRLIARGARFRLPSWMIRDAALRASGLLNPELGGPPVRPYQPPGVWEEMFMGRFKYEPSDGPDQYRRTLYAFWRRSAAPTFLFDSAQRRVCEVRAPRTNTPLQALTLLNDQTILESARALAVRALGEKANEAERINVLTQSILSRPASPAEQAVLSRELRRALDYYRGHPAETARWLSHGQSRVGPKLDPAEVAAYAVAADLVFNLDEAITHE